MIPKAVVGVGVGGGVMKLDDSPLAPQALMADKPAAGLEGTCVGEGAAILIPLSILGVVVAALGLGWDCKGGSPDQTRAPLASIVMEGAGLAWPGIPPAPHKLGLLEAAVVPLMNGRGVKPGMGRGGLTPCLGGPGEEGRRGEHMMEVDPEGGEEVMAPPPMAVAPPWPPTGFGELPLPNAIGTVAVAAAEVSLWLLWRLHTRKVLKAWMRVE